MIQIEGKDVALEDIRGYYHIDAEAARALCLMQAKASGNLAIIVAAMKEFLRACKDAPEPLYQEVQNLPHEDFNEEDEYLLERMRVLSQEFRDRIHTGLSLLDDLSGHLEANQETFDQALGEIATQVEAASSGQELEKAMRPLYLFENDPAAFLEKYAGGVAAGFGECMQSMQDMQKEASVVGADFALLNSYAEALGLENRVELESPAMNQALHSVAAAFGLDD